MPDDPLAERVTASEVVHRGYYMTFRVDTIERADGSTGTRDIVGHPGAIAVLALDERGDSRVSERGDGSRSDGAPATGSP